MSEEEKKVIKEQYKEGLVNLSNVIEPLINQFKTDYSLDIQQCRLIINYLLMEIEELKEKTKKCEYYEMVADELSKNSISKDKIKAILQKYGNKEIEYAPDFYKEIQSLLEEEKR